MADDSSVFPGFDRMCCDSGELIDSLVRQRRTLGLSQTEVAARMGTSQSALARVESGRSDVRMSTVARYADAVDADVGFTVRSRATAALDVSMERGDGDGDGDDG